MIFTLTHMDLTEDKRLLIIDVTGIWLAMAEADVSFLEEDERSEETFRRQLRKEQRSMIHDLQSE